MLPAGSPLSDWLTWLETLSPNEIELGLDRVRSVFERLDLSPPAHVLLVAGTNGKGSSVAMLTAILRASGLRVGAYTSPHINDYNERIVVETDAATDEQIIAAFEKIEAVRCDVPLTYFEFGTLAAMQLFAEAALDVWILEVGMGGRLDATNVVDPTACLITNVSLDHCGWLGEDIESIAYEKAGVMRRGVPAVYASGDAPRAVLDVAEDCGASLLLAGRDFGYESDDAEHWSWWGGDRELRGLRVPGLQGDFQLQNAAGVLALLFAAGLGGPLDNALLDETLPTVELNGRSQALTLAGTDWLLDVAHNPAAAAALATNLESRRLSGHSTWAIIGLLDDKDVEGIVAPLDDAVDHWTAVTADSDRALPADECGRRIANQANRPCRVGDSLAEAMEYVRRKAPAGDTVLVMGSFYIVGPALQILELYSRPES